MRNKTKTKLGAWTSFFAVLSLGTYAVVCSIPAPAEPLAEEAAELFLTADEETGCVNVGFTTNEPIEFMWCLIKTTTTGSNPPRIYPYDDPDGPWNDDPCCPFFACINYEDVGNGMYQLFAWGHCNFSGQCEGTFNLANVEFDDGGTVEIILGEVGKDGTYSQDSNCDFFTPTGVGLKVTVEDDPAHSCDPYT